MDIYSNGSVVVATIPLVTEGGKILAPASVSYRLTNQDDVEVQGSQAIMSFALGDPSVEVTIPGAINTLGVDQTRSLINVIVTTAELDGSTGVVNYAYIIEGSAIVVVGSNSYQTLGQGIILSQDMPDTESWDAAADRSKKAALIEAYNRIGALTFVVDGMEIIGVNRLTTDEFATLPDEFVSALKKAQVSEADVILGGDPIHKKREEGLLSDSVGESSIMFRPGKPLLLSVSRRSMNYLSGYISYSNALGRR